MSSCQMSPCQIVVSVSWLQLSSSPGSPRETKHSSVHWIFKCCANISLDDFIVKRRAWKHKNPIVLNWNTTLNIFHQLTPATLKLSWLDLRSGIIRWDARCWDLRWKLGLVISPGCQCAGCQPGHGSVPWCYILVITAQRKPLLITSQSSSLGDIGTVRTERVFLIFQYFGRWSLLYQLFNE